MVVESDQTSSGVEQMKRAYESVTTARYFADAAGPAWDAVTTSEGYWAVRPNADGVVYLDVGVAATDADDGQAISTLFRAAQVLPFTKPVVVTHRQSADQVQERLTELGLNWPLRLVEGTSSKPKLGL